MWEGGLEGRMTHLPNLRGIRCKCLTWKSGYASNLHGGRLGVGMEGNRVRSEIDCEGKEGQVWRASSRL
jgi:hypothetical protein